MAAAEGRCEMTRRLLARITSLGDLRQRAKTDERYARLAIVAAQNLGGSAKDVAGALRWLGTNADETDERGVVNEVNFCRDLISEPKSGKKGGAR